MDQFVCVRLVQAETFDLSLFQFDWDMSFAVFLMHADGTIYGRYGSRSDFSDSERDISLAGLKLALETALQWHANIDAMRPLLADKRGPEPRYKNYGQFPTGKTSRYARGFGDFSGRCTHCHDLRTAQQFSHSVLEQPIDERDLFAWPMPDAIGLKMDPRERAKVVNVSEGTAAARAGFRAADELLALEGQPLLSTADIQWVLHRADDTDQLAAQVRRENQRLTLTIDLPAGWRRKASIDWRLSTRVLRKRWLRGIEFRELFAKDRPPLELPRDALALRAARGVSRNARGPIRRGDVIVAVDGRREAMSEIDLLAYFAQQKQPGDVVQLTVLRDGQRVDVAWPIE